MTLTKCDLCRKIVKKDDKYISTTIGWNRNELCLSCGKPVLTFLRKKKLIDRNPRLAGKSNLEKWMLKNKSKK